MNINGNELEARPLTLVEVRKCQKLDDLEADVMSVAWSFGVLPDEARAWFDRVPAGEALKAIREVSVASGLVEGAQFPVATGNDAGLERASG